MRERASSGGQDQAISFTNVLRRGQEALVCFRGCSFSLSMCYIREMDDYSTLSCREALSRDSPSHRCQRIRHTDELEAPPLQVKEGWKRMDGSMEENEDNPSKVVQSALATTIRKRLWYLPHQIIEVCTTSNTALISRRNCNGIQSIASNTPPLQSACLRRTTFAILDPKFQGGGEPASIVVQHPCHMSIPAETPVFYPPNPPIISQEQHLLSLASHARDPAVLGVGSKSLSVCPVPASLHASQ